MRTSWNRYGTHSRELFRCKRPPDVRDDPKRPVKASPRTYFLMRDLWRFLAAGSQPHSPWDRDVACVLGPSVRPTAVRQGTDVLHVPKQTHFGQDTFGMPPWTEGRAQARSLLAPYAWHGSQRNRELPMVDRQRHDYILHSMKRAFMVFLLHWRLPSGRAGCPTFILMMSSWSQLDANHEIFSRMHRVRRLMCEV